MGTCRISGTTKMQMRMKSRSTYRTLLLPPRRSTYPRGKNEVIWTSTTMSKIPSRIWMMKLTAKLQILSLRTNMIIRTEMRWLSRIMMKMRKMAMIRSHQILLLWHSSLDTNWTQSRFRICRRWWRRSTRGRKSLTTKKSMSKRKSSSQLEATSTQAIKRAPIAVKAARKSKIQVSDMLLDRRSKAMSRKKKMSKKTKAMTMKTLNLTWKTLLSLKDSFCMSLSSNSIQVS